MIVRKYQKTSRNMHDLLGVEEMTDKSTGRFIGKHLN
jgi:hypothetical protein